MKFEEILTHIKNGEVVRRSTWQGSESFIALSMETHTYTIRQDDMFIVNGTPVDLPEKEVTNRKLVYYGICPWQLRLTRKEYNVSLDDLLANDWEVLPVESFNEEVGKLIEKKKKERLERDLTIQR